MHPEYDKADFSKRLSTALRLAGLDMLSLAQLTTKFNRNHPNKSAPQAVYNWLISQSIHFR